MIRDWFKRWKRRRPEIPWDPFDEVLGATARKLKTVDPDTSRQWGRLRLIPGREEAAQRVLWTRLRSPRFAVAYAAVAAILVGAGLLWLNQSSSTTYATGRGRQMTLTLSDSSQIILNHSSELVVEQQGYGKARLTSLKGEAFFHVRNTGSPFIVSTDVATVRVLGTEFNVRVRDGQLSVAVVRGSVRVTAGQAGRDSAVVLAAGQITVCDRGDFPGAPGPIPFPDYPGWTHGKFVFYHTTLSSACREIASQFDADIRIDNPLSRGETITGALNGGSVEAALSTLAMLTGKQYRHENGSYTLY